MVVSENDAVVFEVEDAVVVVCCGEDLGAVYIGGKENRGGGTYSRSCVVWGKATSTRTVPLGDGGAVLVELEVEHQRAEEVPTPIWSF